MAPHVMMKIPWQYEWKRPQMDEYAVSLSSDHREIDDSLVSLTAAMVDPLEVNLSISSPLLFTVSLYSEFGTLASLGRRMHLRLLHTDSQGNEVQSRELRWPGSMLDDDRGEGILAVELCRKPNHMKSLTSADALDVIKLMSLGIVDAVSIQVSEKSREEIEAVIDSPELQNSDREELVLACLTSDGRVHLYKALDLLNPIEPFDWSENDFSVGMASLLMGHEIFKRVQESLYPLSRPCGTVQLSIPLKRKEPRKAKFHVPFLFPREEQERNDLNLWDESMWNATVEQSTAIHRTLNNIPTGMVSISQYVVVFGRGSRVRRIRNKQRVPQQHQDRDHDELKCTDEFDESKSEDISEWWQGEAETKNSLESQGEGEPWWKPESVEGDVGETTEIGGFVTFIDLCNNSEARTLYLPCAPKALYPFAWGELVFVMIVSDECATPTNCPSAFAVRVDSTRKQFFACGSSPVHPSKEELEMISADGCLSKKPPCHIRRFALIPIILPIEDYAYVSMRTTTVSLHLGVPPSIELLFSSRRSEEDSLDVALTLNHLNFFDLISSGDLPVSYRYNDKFSLIPVIRTSQRIGSVARMTRSFTEEDIKGSWSRSFQGCSFFFIGGVTSFICWHGASEEEGAFVRELVDHNEDLRKHCIGCTILSLERYNESSSVSTEIYKASTEPTENIQEDLRSNDEGPDLRSLTSDSNSFERVSDIVIDALDSISSLSYRGTESLLSPTSSPKLKRSQRLSHLEKSLRLVQHCDSWAKLGDTLENRAMFDAQIPVVMFACRAKIEVFSLRECFVKNRDETPFSQVLSWLSQREDYFTASCIALGLLRDVESWHNLQRLNSVGKYGGEDDRDTLNCLLDGVNPLFPKEFENQNPKQSVVSNVADLAIGCLAKGGLHLSRALASFLRHNEDYDPSKATLMLVAVATRCVSREEETVNVAMGPEYVYTQESDPEEMLWALRAALSVGVARDQLSQAIMLINVAMPDELRCRKPKGANSYPPPMSLSKAIVSTIVAASPDAASLMLGLIDEESRKRYWGSLTREAQLEFALINVDDRCPLLLQEEVRVWALNCLDECVSKEALPNAINLNDLMPNQWLQRLCEGCLLNAECEYGQILTYGVSDSFIDDDEGTTKYFEEFELILEAITPMPGTGGLDFDVLIPALLVLQQREIDWNEEAIVSTQRIVDAACYMAGRHQPSAFVFDGSKVMQQCASASNVSAGAHLVGGTNGLVLHCCDILMRGAMLDMVTAESYILNEDLLPSALNSQDSPQDTPFSITDGHRQVLWLLMNHVLNIRTFGEFRPVHLRGKVDPVFAAQACLRTWLALSSSMDSTPWLVNWFRRILELDKKCVSPKRLACAALTRVLLWPTSVTSQVPLATIMGVESTFLIQLAQSCHGLIESIPDAMAEDIIAEANLSVQVPKALVNV